MSARLVPLTPGSAPIIPVQRPVVLIGRHPECDVRLDEPKVSRRHCCVAQVYDRLVLRDLGSRNGLRVNGRSVDEAQLRAGDEVAIGPLLFRLEVEAPAPVSTPSLPAPPAAKASLAPPAADPPARPPSLPGLPPADGLDDDLLPLDL